MALAGASVLALVEGLLEGGPAYVLDDPGPVASLGASTKRVWFQSGG